MKDAEPLMEHAMANRFHILTLWLALALVCPPNFSWAADPAPSCAMPRDPKAIAAGPISVRLNPSTNWQPRGGQVLIEISSDDAALGGLHYIACFTWDDIDPASYGNGAVLQKWRPGTDAKDQDPVLASDWTRGFAEIRPSNRSGLVNLGVTVPPLGSSPSNLASRWHGDYPFTGMGLVPVSYLRVIGYDKNNSVVADELLPIGITSIKLALMIAIGTVALALFVIHSLVVIGRSRPAGGRPQKAGGILSLTWLLYLSPMPDGRASLSGFQVLIWTLVIAGGSVYVMALSGDLVDLPPGALTVLGIAGAAKLLSANADGRAAKNAAQTTQLPATGDVGLASAPKPGAALDPVPVPASDPAPLDPAALGLAPAAALRPTGPTVFTKNPAWQDLIFEPGTQTPNVSRMQMLLFTVVSAAFVLTQVLNYYVIPDIPTGYQILMGISNGIYVGRKFTG